MTRGSGRNHGSDTVNSGFSIEYAIDTAAAVACGFDTRYRRIATGKPESSAACGMNGAERVESDPHGEATVAEGHLGQRELAGEPR